MKPIKINVGKRKNKEQARKKKRFCQNYQTWVDDVVQVKRIYPLFIAQWLNKMNNVET